MSSLSSLANPVQAADNDPQVQTFWQLASPVRREIAVSGILCSLGAILTILPVWLIVELLDRARHSETDGFGMTSVGWYLAGILGSVALQGVLMGAAYGISHRADARFGEHLRQRQIDHLLRLPLSWFSRTASGKVKKYVEDDVLDIHQLIAHVVPDVASGVWVPLSSLIFLFVLDYRIGLIALIPVAATVLAMPLMMRDVESKFVEYDRHLKSLNATTVELIRGISVIKMFESNRFGFRRFLERSDAYATFGLEWVRLTVHGSAAIGVFSSPVFAVGVMALGGTWLVTNHGVDPLHLLAGLILSVNITQPLLMLGMMGQFMKDANKAAASITRFLAEPEVIPPTFYQEPSDASIELDRVEFSYVPEVPVLTGLTERLESGDFIALVGPSGAGKSTIAMLLPRLLDPIAGTVRVGGVATTDFTEEQLYTQVGFVFQDPYLLDISVRDNIALSHPDASMIEVERVAKAAHIYDRIMRLPDGFDTIVDEGAHLSGGEQQRVAIARAMLVDAPVVVLDEATAFADPDSETAIQRGLSQLVADRTVVVIAHRLHTIINADQILVMDQGRVVERGTHNQLITQPGLYADLWRTYQQSRQITMKDAGR